MLDISVGEALFLVSLVESRVEKELHKRVEVLCDFVKKLTSTSAGLRLSPVLLSNLIYKQQIWSLWGSGEKS